MPLRLALASLALLLATAAPAAAHVGLEATEPEQGAVVDVAPERVLLRFSGQVVPAAGDDVTRPSPNEVAQEGAFDFTVAAPGPTQTTESPTTSTSTPTTTTPLDLEVEDDDAGWVPLAIGAVVLVLLVAGAAAVARSRRGS